MEKLMPCFARPNHVDRLWAELRFLFRTALEMLCYLVLPARVSCPGRAPQKAGRCMTSVEDHLLSTHSARMACLWPINIHTLGCSLCKCSPTAAARFCSDHNTTCPSFACCRITNGHYTICLLCLLKLVKSSLSLSVRLMPLVTQ